MIAPHGGRLINRMAAGDERTALLAKVAGMPKVVVNNRELADIEMISSGAMSPLEGFMTQADYLSVLDSMRLAKGLPWSLPVVLAVKEGDGAQYREGQELALVDERGSALAVLTLEEKYKVKKDVEAQKALGTTDASHPGVQYLKTVGDYYLGGPIRLLNRIQHTTFAKYRLDPKETRVLFKARKWQTIAAFQTRNPIHRAHEYITKCALEITDGLMLHPLVGETKGDDIPADVRMKCYEVLMKDYYPKDRVVLAVYPQAMRYGGPREAIFHAVIRKNYGCTHLIVGRDHAGVGSFYGSYDAQQLFDRFAPGELGITPLKFENSFWCTRTNTMATAKTSPSTPEERISLSGTKVREMLRNGELPPPEFSRPEVAQILIDSMREQQPVK
jgi:sulfate adenylyltransferase